MYFTNLLRFFVSGAFLFLISGAGMLHAQQPTDLAVGEILAPTGIIEQGRSVQISFTIQNLGPAQAVPFTCGVQVFDVTRSATVFQEEINVANLNVDQTIELQTTNSWTTDLPGPYIVQVDIFNENETAPSNNSLGIEVEVAGEPELLTLQEAVDILNQQILDNHPRVDSLVALHLSPPANPSDSLVPPGLLIESADSSLILEYDYPVYFFFVDLYPDELFGHPCEYVAISAIDGKVDHHVDVEIWPEIDGETPSFGPDCFGEANPRRVRGNGRQCVAKANPYQPVNTSNTDDWGLVVVGKLNKTIEKTTVQHDICSWKERINGESLGPAVTGPNISSHSGQNNCGLTEKELCDAIDAFKGKACDKFYFKYIGHGIRRGIVLWNDTRKRSKVLSWTDLACKLKDAGIREACIEITACHSGAAIAALRKKGIKGTVITSSSTSRTTPVGDGSGTYWEKALRECSKDRNADLNKNNKIDLCELYAWVKVNGGTRANRPNPQINKLDDSLKLRSIRKNRVGNRRSISTGNGSIRVYAERICVRLDIKGQRRDSVIYRGYIYLENTGRSRRTSDRTYQIIGRCNRKDTVLATIRPSVAAKSKVCIAEFPNSCTGIKLKRLRSRGTIKDGHDDHIILSSAPDESLSSIDEVVAHNAGDFIFYRHLFEESLPDEPHTTSIGGPSDWDLSVEPGDFNQPAAGSQDIFTGAFIPEDATEGGEVTSTVVNTSTSDTLLLRYAVHLLDTIEGTVSSQLNGDYKWYDVIGSSTQLLSDDISLTNSHLEIEDILSLQTRADANWLMNNVTMNADSGTFLQVDLVNGAVEMEGVTVRGTDRVVVSGGDVILRDFVVAKAQEDGITLSDIEPQSDTVDLLTVIGANRYGVTISGAPSGADTMRIDWLRVEFADSADIAFVGSNINVKCVDCEYDEGSVRIEQASGNTLSRYATLSVAAVDTADVALADIDITVTDIDGNVLYNGKTDADGFIPDLELSIGFQDESTMRSHRSFIIVASNTWTEQRDTVEMTTYTQTIFEFIGGPSSVPIAGERTTTASIVSIAPQPVSLHKGVVIETVGLDTRMVDISLHSTLGDVIWSETNRLVEDNRLFLEGFDPSMSSGVYILRVHLGDGEFLSAKIVIQ